MIWWVGRAQVTRRDGSEGLGSAVWVLALVGLACAGVVAYSLVPAREFGSRPAGGLPGYAAVVTVVFIAQFGGVVLLAGQSRSGPLGVWAPLAAAAVAAAGASLLWSDPASLRLDASEPGQLFLTTLVAVVAAIVTALVLPARGRAARLLDGDPRSRPAWGARGPAIVFGLGWLLAMIYSVGALYRLAD